MVLIYLGGSHSLGKTTAIKLVHEKLGNQFYYIRGSEFVKKKFRKQFPGKKFGEQTDQELHALIEKAAQEIVGLSTTNPKKLIVVDAHFVIQRSGQKETNSFTQLIPECAKYFDGLILVKGDPNIIQQRRVGKNEIRKREKTRHSTQIKDIERECYACALEAKALAAEYHKPLSIVDCSSNQKTNAFRIERVLLSLLNKKYYRRKYFVTVKPTLPKKQKNRRKRMVKARSL